MSSTVQSFPIKPLLELQNASRDFFNFGTIALFPGKKMLSQS